MENLILAQACIIKKPLRCLLLRNRGIVKDDHKLGHGQPLGAGPEQRLLWEHSSLMSLGLHLLSGAHQAWSRLSQSWRWYPAHRPKNIFSIAFRPKEMNLHSQSTCPAARRSDEWSQEQSARCLQPAGHLRSEWCIDNQSHVNCRTEVETGVSLVNDLELFPLDKAAHLWLPCKDVWDKFSADLFLVVVLQDWIASEIT